ncbi:MAG: hypothetical protein Q6L60_14050 [Thermostichus sp. HHBFW_bins_43]
MERSTRNLRTRTQGNLRRLWPILAEIFEESKPRLWELDHRLTGWVRSRRWGMDPTVPKVLIYVLVAVVVLVIPILTLAALVALLAFLAIQIGKKWPQADPARQTERRYLRSAADDQAYDYDSDLD